MNNRTKIIWFNVAVTFVCMFFYLTVLHIWSANTALWTALVVLAIICLVVGSSINTKAEDVSVYAIILAVFGAALSLVAEELFHRALSTVGVVIAVVCMLLAVALYFVYIRWITKEFTIRQGTLVWTLICQSAVMSFLVIYARN